MTNFKWLQPIQNLLLEILADEALHGNKQSNTFKHAPYAKVTEAITEKFMIECTPKHVEHRFKTLKTNWNTIALLRDKKSGFGWNDDLKMITSDRAVYDEELEVKNFYSLRPTLFVLFEKSNILREHHLLFCLPYKNV